MSDFIYFGHRGARGLEPENTLLSIRTAIEQGLKWIEVDVYSVENELVVIHDKRLERTTNGFGKVEKNSLAYIRSLDAGKGEKIPFLREVFDLFDGKFNINIELKGDNTAKPVSELIYEYINSGKWRTEQFLVSSFKHNELKEFRKIASKINVGALTSKIPPQLALFAQRLDAFSVNANLDKINRDFVVDTHHRGMKFYVYTVNTIDELNYVKELGVDGVFTDFPELAMNG